jgi:hypothetical protein
MATYTSDQLNKSGSLGEELSGAKTFTITNYTSSIDNNYHVGYLTLEGNSTSNKNLSSKTFLTGSFSGFTGGASDDTIVSGSFGWSITLSGNAASFIFTPTSTIAANSYYIKGVGLFDLEIT